MAVKCPCGTRIFGQKKEGEKFTCYKCQRKLTIKQGKVVEE